MSTEILVNGEEQVLENDVLTYDLALELAGKTPAPGYTVYFRGSADLDRPEGALAQGSKITARHHMQVTVSFTDTAQAQ